MWIFFDDPYSFEHNILPIVDIPLDSNVLKIKQIKTKSHQSLYSIYEIYKRAPRFPLMSRIWAIWMNLTGLLTVKVKKWVRRSDLSGIKIKTTTVNVTNLAIYS